MEIIPRKPKPTADRQRRTAARDDAVSILHTLINHMHVDGAYLIDKPCSTVQPSGQPLLTVRISADVPRHVFEYITHWDADADPDLDGSDEGECEICTDHDPAHL